jgi:hypothetical protein
MPTILAPQATQNGDDEEDDWLPVPVLRNPMPDLLDNDDDEVLGRHPETISRPLGPRRVTLTLKATNVPQKRVRYHVTS